MTTGEIGILLLLVSVCGPLLCIIGIVWSTDQDHADD